MIQAHLIRCGDRYLAYTDGMGIRRNRTRLVASPTGDKHVNRALGTLAGEFVNN